MVALFENLIIAEKMKQSFHRYTHKEFYFWRDSNGHEIDSLKPTGTTFDIFEIKSTSTVTAEHFKGLAYMKEIAPDAVGARSLIYGGREDQERSEYKVRGWKSEKF